MSEGAMDLVKIANESDFEKKTINKYDIGLLEISIVKHNGKYYAFEDRCPHMNSALHLGRLDGEYIICPFHNAKFNFVTGKKVSGPKIPIPKFIKMGSLMHNIKTHDLKTYVVTVENGEIFADISSQ